MRFLKRLVRKLPANVRHRLNIYLRYWPSDIRDLFTGKRRDLVPPKRLIFTGDQDFVEVGDEFLRHFRALGKIQPHHSILDLGSGIGRMARPLTKFLNAEGRYEGFDIVAMGVNWCRKNITPRYPNFRFQVSDVYNKLYNPGGKARPGEYVFPYPDATFDFVFATSVFTHMFPADIQRYASEIARVLKPGGRALLTFLLINEESEKLIAAGKSSLPLAPFRDFWTSNPEVPEDALGVPETLLATLARDNGLEIEAPVRYGRWCGRDVALSYQDLVVFRKPSVS